jgi:hypothetical protein
MIRLSGYETLAACTVRMGALDGRRGGGLLCGSGVVRPHALHCAVSWRVNVRRAPARLRGAFLTGDRVGVRLVRHRRSRIAAIRPESPVVAQVAADCGRLSKPEGSWADCLWPGRGGALALRWPWRPSQNEVARGGCPERTPGRLIRPRHAASCGAVPCAEGSIAQRGPPMTSQKKRPRRAKRRGRRWTNAYANPADRARVIFGRRLGEA